jgi:hypothetical protein
MPFLVGLGVVGKETVLLASGVLGVPGTLTQQYVFA